MVKGLAKRLSKLLQQNDVRRSDDRLFRLPSLGSEEQDEIEPVETLNQEMQRILDRVEVAELTVHLDDDTTAMLDRAAAEAAQNRDQTLRVALAYGLVALSAENMGAGENDEVDHLSAKLNNLESDYAALKFQVFKLRDAVFAEELRVAGAEGMVQTFLDQIARGRRAVRREDHIDGPSN